MQNQKIKIRLAEIGLIAFVWVVLFITPIVFKENNGQPLWESIARQFEVAIPLTLLFVLNRFVFVPKYLFHRKPVSYFALLLVSIALLAAGTYLFTAVYKKQPRPTQHQKLDERRPPKPEVEDASPPDNRPQRNERKPEPVPPFANFLVLSILIVGFDTGLKTVLRWMEVENEKMQLEKTNIATQLVMLQNQVSPHFFMNTLNNIHSLVDKRPVVAKEAIIKLSKMMRYLLYETENDRTPLRKEIEFLESYIDLMKLRFSQKVKIMLNLPDEVPDKAIPPFLFVPIIENAFKHGISYKSESFIEIDLTIGNDKLLMVVKNSKTDKKVSDDFSGIGIENTRKRLELLFGNNFSFDIFDNPNTFTVNLSIPI